MAIETTGKTIDLAISAALTQLGADRDSVTVEVLENPKTGFLGIGGTPAKVRVTRIGEEEPASPAPAAVPPKPTVRQSEKAVPAAPVKEKPLAVEKAAPAAKPELKPAAKAEPKTEPKPAKQTPPPGKPSDGDAARILKGILERMGLPNATISEIETEHHLQLNVNGANLGRLIGRRGETLDAVQRIVSAAYNRGKPERRRIVIDAEKYRAKREDALTALAVSTAEKVVRYNRDMLLEPMNAYSRHVIHTALQENPYVTTHSVGNEPQRRVIISLSGAKKKPPLRQNGEGKP
ncbi:MAG: Jag N-terminal domain-containing protein [Oscillospiraceae bacterium]|jgi:spoIIIJ-associated protein|nr:Jag N-terminal domain-containing protein [Oscillospiraceae bacterium]